MIKISDFFRPNNVLGVPYRGIVVDNDDPRKLGRLKVRIEGLLEDETEENLPWVYQKSSSMMGGRTDLSFFAVPEEQSEVIVEFPYDDIYAGFYTGYWQSETTHQGYLNEDYPHSYGFRDIQNTFLKVDKGKKFLEFQHASGARVFIDHDSTIELKSSKAIKLRSLDEKTEFVFDMETGEVKFDTKGEMELSGARTLHTGKEVIHKIGTLDQTINGSKVCKVGGGSKLVVGGGHSESILSDKATSVGGDLSNLVAGEVNDVIGLGKTTTIVIGGEEKDLLLGSKKTTLLLGNYEVSILAGNIEIKTLAGGVETGNALATLEIDLLGGIKLSNFLGEFSVDPTGSIEVSNLLGSMKIDPVGGITMDATLTMKLKSLLLAEFSGLVQTKVGSPIGITQVDGTLITIGGPAGLPIAYLGAMCVGVGNLGIPVISTIALGSFTCLVRP